MKYNEIRAVAKSLGINTKGMKKIDIEAEVEALQFPPPGQMQEPDNVYHEKYDETQSAEDPRAPRSEDREERETRKKRRPLGGPSLKLDYPTRPGYHRHWMNDHKNRLHDADETGYEFVEEDHDGRQMKVTRRVGVHEDGSPMLAYLMEIRQEFYDDDQAAKQAEVDEIDRAILRPDQPNDSEAVDPHGFYTPDEGTHIRVER